MTLARLISLPLQRIGLRPAWLRALEARQMFAAAAATIADGDAYIALPGDSMRVLQPWRVDRDIKMVMDDINAAARKTLVNWDRMWTLKCAAMQTRDLPGEVWEVGVYQGGSALLLKRLSAQRPTQLRFFDTFAGLPAPHPAYDGHHEGEFADTSLEDVRRFIGTGELIDYRQGIVPDSFAGLEGSAIRLAHIDVDLYPGTRGALEFIYPRLVPGGVIVDDDYGFVSCPGARRAVDEFFADKRETPMILATGQAVVHRLP